MPNGRDGSDKWVEAALAALAEGGIERVRVEVVAERLGVTKGGFYRRFKDRRALLDAMLETWRAGRIAVIQQQTALAGLSPRERLKALVQLYTERVSAQGMAIELAIRQWARADESAAAAAAGVDAARLQAVAELYRRLGLSADDAQGRAILFYAFIFGQSLLFLTHAPRRRASLLAACADTLTDID
ncbi:MAG TPA: TetR/AcrR family transcriptional regulator [Hyphomicrobiaceae bacterium]|jgi:AcrR family transcriptional regulator|nr:TetR/AcrR family transcriptional regulator [Hyphomicrobiaceae bacterium]